MKNKYILFLLILLSNFALIGQTINDNTRIKSTGGMFWVYNDGTFTLHNKNSGNAIVFEHLKIADDAFLYVTSQTALTVTGDLIQGSGSDKLVLESDANGTASLITYGNVSGLSKSEKFLEAANPYGYTIASPMQNAPHSTFTGHVNTFFYNATAVSWEPIDMNAGTMEIMRGYWTKFSSDKTLEFSDVLNTGTISFTDLYRTAPYGYGNMGWNFLGNPYPSAIDWKEVEVLNVNGAITIPPATPFTDSTKLNYAVYIFDNDGAYLAYVNGVGQTGFNHGIIPAHAGFWVQVNKDYYDPATALDPVQDAKIRLNNSVRVHETLYSGSKTNHTGIIRLALQRDNYQDEIVVRLIDGATVDFDPNFDAAKMFAESNSTPQFFMQLPGNNKLAINSLPENLELPYLIPLGIKSIANKTHKIQINLNEFTYNNIDLHLEDKVTGVFADLRLNNTYSYNALSNDENQRFVLHLGALTGLTNNAPSALQIYAHHNTIYITGLEEHVVFSLFNMLGQEIQRMHLEPGSHVISADVVTGPYIVRITGSRKMETRKIYIETLN